MTDFDLNNQKCQQCGLCCKIVGKDFWKRTTLTKEQETQLFSLAKSVGSDACNLLVKTGERYYCLIHKTFGYEAKADLCKNYPGDNLCIRENIEQKEAKIEVKRQAIIDTFKSKLGIEVSTFRANAVMEKIRKGEPK